MGSRFGAALVTVAAACALLVGAAPSQAAYPLAQNGRIVFEHVDTGSDDIWIINPDGSGATNLTKTADPISTSSRRSRPTRSRSRTCATTVAQTAATSG